MIRKLGNDKKVGNAHIRILYPGVAFKNSKDTGLGTIGRIDHAQLAGGVTIKMHPHINDDILSYFRTGYAQHIDSEGFEAEVSRHKLMLMKAGKVFYHEEHSPEPLEGLQIFIRPRVKDAVPEVTFMDLPETDSLGKWRLIASPDGNVSELIFTSDTLIYDLSLEEGSTIPSPNYRKEEMTGLLYVFQGMVTVNSDLHLSKGESIVFKQEEISINALEKSELVLFLTNENSEYYDKGMYSGNQYAND